MKSLAICLVFFLTFLLFQANAQLLHAHCELEWDFKDAKCNVVFDYFVEQWKNFSVPEVKQSNYTLISADASKLSIVGIHTTPVHLYVDDVIMNMKQSDDTCIMKGKSTSRAVSIYDYNTNYCNLFNLLRKYTGKDPSESLFECRFHDRSQCDEY